MNYFRCGNGSGSSVIIDGKEVDEVTLESVLANENKSISTLPYSFYNGSAVVLNDEIHILGGGDGDTRIKHYSVTQLYYRKVG